MHSGGKKSFCVSMILAVLSKTSYVASIEQAWTYTYNQLGRALRNFLMFGSIYAAYLFSVLIAVVALFQLALALGAPWGELAMGGKFSGRLPSRMRIVALVQVMVLALVALIVLTRAGVINYRYLDLSKTAIWVVVMYSFIGTILNVITPSKNERLLWAPIAVVLLICSTYVAMS